MFNKLMGVSGGVSMEKLMKDYGMLLADNEEIRAGFQVIRDTFIFTSKRLILIDVQGMTGRKKEYLSIPYSKITMFSVESAGHFDLDADLKIWVGSYSVPIEKKFNRHTNIYAVQKCLAELT